MKAFAPIVFLAVLAGCATNPGAEFDRLVADYEAAGHGAYYESQVAPSREASEAGATLDRAEWDAARQRLAAQKDAWSQALEASASRPPAFYALDAAAADRYQVLASDAVAAEELLEGEPTLTDVTALAFLWNPAIRAARANAKAKLEQYSQVSYLDDMLHQYNAFTKQLNTAVGQPRHKQMVAMNYPFPGGLALKGRIVTEDVRIAERDVDIAAMDVVTAVRIAYYDYLFVGESLRINREAASLLDQMIYIAQAKLSVGIGKYHSVIMGQVESARLADMLLTQEEQRETIVARINTLLDRPPGAPLGLPSADEDDDVLASLDELYAAGVKGSQELQKQRTMIARMDLMIEMATRMTYLDATLGASYFEDRTALRAGVRPTSPTFATRPMPGMTKAAAFSTGVSYVREAQTLHTAHHAMLASTTNAVELAIRTHYFGMDRARRSIALHRHSLLPQATQALEAASTAYQTAQVDFVTLLDAERTLLRIQLGEHAALRDYRTHLAELDRAIGSAAPRKPLAAHDITGADGDGESD